MASNKTKFNVGLFVLGGIALIILTIIWMGINNTIAQANRYVIFFDESIQGLDVGSQVKYRGVPVGRVESLSIAPDSKLIQATIAIRPEHDIAEHSVAQLRSVGITGGVYIGLDVITNAKLAKRPNINFPVQHPVIISIPSSKSELMQSMETIADKAQATDTAGMSVRIIELLDKTNKILDEINVAQKSEKMDKVLTAAEDSIVGIQTLTQQLEVFLNENRKSVKSSLQQVEERVDQTKSLIESGKSFVDKANELVEESQLVIREGRSTLDFGKERVAGLESSAQMTMRNLDQMILHMSELITRLEQQPSLILAEPPAPRTIQ